ncbi:MAG: hypothetical protein UU12_C0044G0005 [Candidatus Woesebacteria bacterium GW2011_GWA2_40_7b]|uniref:Uncharacterized protein n=1 Tax=Candidatus Woesebacteria bacterium GW2011_GWA2_40_7b TaxID=1618563 RepID=A0A0G0W2L9_9BACT|nr:MAG: hypothetical protein UU12_C0044G0005 [Candidatus Woesebacteria bacterium GW2011_GWA2_40_7b]
MGFFERLANKIITKWKKLVLRLKGYFKRLLFPLYLFPIKLFTYSTYYLVKFLLKLILSIIGLIFETLIFPFKSLKNFLKSLVTLVVSLYLFASLFVIEDYLRTQYGWYGKLFLSSIFTPSSGEPFSLMEIS